MRIDERMLVEEIFGGVGVYEELYSELGSREEERFRGELMVTRTDNL